MTLPLIAITGLSLLIAGADGDHTRQARAHTHGEGEALIAIEGNELFIQIAAPAANFVSASGSVMTANEDGPLSFEAGDVASVEKGANCSLESLVVENEMLSGGAEHDHGEHDHDEHDHSEHDHDEHAGHDEHDHDEHGDDHSGHSNYLLTYEATCANPDKIKSVDFTLFETWSGFEKLRTTFLTDDGSGAKTLTPSSTRMDRP
ncbi:MAG: hypothetical protein CMK09_05305 [Ponticaulis sp.]|nr:hypothetical protein [Ponticaulis sp.]|tara:strand:+ start:10194 stop:10805 length:612 start_codon:yes stop_codon:yes gene_type:complete